MPRWRELRARRGSTVAAALVAVLLGACAAPSAPAATPPAAATPAAAAPRSPRPAGDFQWPQPLPPCSPDAPFLFKGSTIGTWVPEGDAGFEQAWIDEHGLREAWTRTSVNRRAWKGFSVASPTVLVDALLADRDGPAVGYVFSLVARADGDPDVEDAPAVLHLRHRGRARVFVDGAQLLDEPAPAAGEWAEARAPLVLSGPYTVVLLKLGRGSPELGASMEVEVRLSAPDGSPLPRQTWNTMRPGSVPPERR